ncbi:MAG: sulfatase-like hydrolase/transferase [Endomicrobiales bacterium]|nr:sulfatase-like hydrolase/transferase [Endomicrobiales bacterium]
MNDKISFETIIDAAKKLILMNLLFLAMMGMFRAVFMLYYGNIDVLKTIGGDVVSAFVLGARYDLGVIGYVNVLVTLTMVITWLAGKKNVFRVWLRAVKYYYVLMFSAVFIVMCVDFGFYSYFKDHINIIIFGVLEDDTKALFSTIFENYNIPLVLMIFGSIIALVILNVRYFISKINTEKPDGRRYVAGVKTAFFAAFVAVNFIAARGSFGLFPLGTMDSAISKNKFVNKLALNGIYSFQEAVDRRMKDTSGSDILSKLGYENNDAQAFADFLGVRKSSLQHPLHLNLFKRTRKNKAVEELRPNVILIVMEGFGSDLMRYDSERFNVMGELKKHFDSDIVFKNFISGDIGTIGSLETMFLNMPKRPYSKAVTQSKYAFNSYATGAAVPYKQSGYETVFLYGGNAAWRDVVSFLGNCGFDSVEGEGTMDPDYARNQWGVYDEFLFDHLYERLSKDDGRPKFIMAMTTSNHPPYSLPKNYEKLPLEIDGRLGKDITGDTKLAVGRFETYQYSNQKLGELITRIKSSEYAKNTIIAVTGDHNFWSVFDYTAERFMAHGGVPLYLYVPDKIKPASIDTAKVGSHLDIMPTLYALSLSGVDYAAMGNDLMSSGPNIAYNAHGLVIAGGSAINCTIENGYLACFVWDGSDKETMRESQCSAGHEKLLKRFKAALSVTEYMLRNSQKEGV